MGLPAYSSDDVKAVTSAVVIDLFTTETVSIGEQPMTVLNA